MMRQMIKNKRANSRFQIDKLSRIMPISKRSQGHIEIILSFLIFIGFLLFMFIFMNPFARVETKDIVRGIKDSIINEISDDVGKLSIIVKTTNDCYDNSKVLFYGSNYLEIPDSTSLRKYTIYYNSIFSGGGAPTCESETGTDYTLGTYSTENMVIYEKIERLRTDYNNNYEDLKTSLGIVDEFIFELKRINGEVEVGVNKGVPFGIEVEAVDIPLRVINSNGVISEFILNIRVW